MVITTHDSSRIAICCSSLVRASFSLVLFILFSAITSLSVEAQVFWTETFENGCSSGCPAGSFVGVNGPWSVSNTGANGTDANQFYVACAENGQIGGECGSACGSNNASLHMGFPPDLIGVFGDGAVYLAGGLGFWFPETDKRAESPTINCTGKSNITLSFSYLENGQTTIDNGTCWYFDGVTWSQLDDMPKTTLCGSGQGLWALRTLSLPSSADNNPNVKIGFRWVNNDDNVGTDPSLAVNNVTLSTPSSNAPVAYFTSNTQTICPGDCINFTNTSTNGPFTSTSWTFTGSSTPSSSDNNPSNICYPNPGTFSVSLTVANADGTDTETIATYITVTNLPGTPQASSNSPVCSGSTITLSTPNVAGGSFSWSGPNGFTSLSQNPSIPNSTPAMSGNYTVTVTVGNCTSSAGSVNVVVNSLPASTTASSNSPVCSGSTLNLSTPTINGASYSWTGPGGFTSQDQNPVISGVSASNAGTYSVTASIGSCSILPASTTVVINPSPATPTASSNAPVCPGEDITLSTPNAPGTVFTWTGPGGFSSASQNPVITDAVASDAGTYSVTLTAAGCTSQAGTVNVTVYPPLVIDATPESSTITQGESVELTATGSTNLIWSPDTGLSCTDCPDPIASPAVTTEYTVTATDVNGCTGSDEVVVIVELPCGEIFVPTHFSPNGDDLNDLQCVMGTCLTSVEFSIFNRWGEKIFSTTDQSVCWDGTFRGQDVDPGVYVFTLRALQSGVKEIKQNGEIHLIR